MSSKAFTLIELLVVVSIIGMISSTVLSNLKSARMKAEDTSMMAQSREVVKEMYVCVNDGGTVQAPTSYPFGGGNLCSNLQYSKMVWPRPNVGWTWASYDQTPILHIARTICPGGFSEEWFCSTSRCAKVNTPC